MLIWFVLVRMLSFFVIDLEVKNVVLKLLTLIWFVISKNAVLIRFILLDQRLLFGACLVCYFITVHLLQY